MAYSGAYRPALPPSPAGSEAPGGTARPLFSAPKTPMLSALMNKMKAIDLENDDLLMMLILYLMYRESGDTQLLILMGAMLLG